MSPYLELIIAFICGIVSVYVDRLDRTKSWLRKVSKSLDEQGIKRTSLEAGAINFLVGFYKFVFVGLLTFTFYNNWRNGVAAAAMVIVVSLISSRLKMIPRSIGYYLSICLTSAKRVASLRSRARGGSFFVSFDSDLEFVRLAFSIYEQLPIGVPSRQYVKSLADGDLMHLKQSYEEFLTQRNGIESFPQNRSILK